MLDVLENCKYRIGYMKHMLDVLENLAFFYLSLIFSMITLLADLILNEELVCFVDMEIRTG
jgi:hypothetical protein